MMSPMKYALVVFVLLLFGSGMWVWRSVSPVMQPVDLVAPFLEGHWRKPLSAQGVPPAEFTAAEASLAPQACGECHTEQYRDWRGSLHSKTMGNGILWQTRMLPPAKVLVCLDCHAPLAEQKALMAQALGWPDAPKDHAPSYVPPDLHSQGLVCAACHVRAHVRYGPPPKPRKPGGREPGLPHAGYRQTEAFADSRFCATCHQFPEDGPSLNGKLLENTLNEWRASRYAAEGRTCQSCHMPGRRHLWRGIHDPEMVRQALEARVSFTPAESGRLRVRAEVCNCAAGHYFPTYLVPRIWLRLTLIDATGAERIRLAESELGRKTDTWLTRELSDTRLAPDEIRVLEAELAVPSESDWSIELRADVAPGEHYERMFAGVLENSSVQLEAGTRSMLEAALAEKQSSRYSLRILQRTLPRPTAN